jgi:hypothetical protein
LSEHQNQALLGDRLGTRVLLAEPIFISFLFVEELIFEIQYHTSKANSFLVF